MGEVLTGSGGAAAMKGGTQAEFYINKQLREK
jgi:hypothetical protein